MRLFTSQPQTSECHIKIQLNVLTYTDINTHFKWYPLKTNWGNFHGFPPYNLPPPAITMFKSSKRLKTQLLETLELPNTHFMEKEVFQHPNRWVERRQRFQFVKQFSHKHPWQRNEEQEEQEKWHIRTIYYSLV